MGKQRKRKKNNKDKHQRPCSHAYEAKTPSSERTRHLRDELNTTIKTYMKINKGKLFEQKKTVYYSFKQQDAEKIKQIIDEKQTYVDAKKKNNKNDVNSDRYYINIHDSDFITVIDTKKEACCVDENAHTLVWHKAERDDWLNQDKFDLVVKSLSDLSLTKKEGKGLRGKAKKEIFELHHCEESSTTCNKSNNNISVGTFAPRNKKGLQEKYIKNYTDTPNASVMWLLSKRITTRIKSIFPSCVISVLNKTLNEIGVQAQMMNKGKKRKIGDHFLNYLPSYCSGGNVHLPFHVDDDAVWSVIIVFRECDVGSKKLYVDLPVIKYFTFENGQSVALRSGDLLLFNPRFHHCISTNVDGWEDVDNGDVYSLTYYLKTKVVSLNDKDLEFKLN